MREQPRVRNVAAVAALGESLSDAQRRAFSRARRSRDPRFDGCFFVGVETTGIYCRPICPAPIAKESNVRYYLSAAAAVSEGFRPCLRCRPEAAPGTPAWQGTATTVRRGLQLIGEGALDNDDVEGLATRLGIGERHLRRLFVEHLGASPLQIATTRRLHFARRLLVETELRITDIAFAAGFGSVRRFNAAFRKTYQEAPRELRRRGGSSADGGTTLRLAYRPPFDFPRLLAYLRPRAIPGVEWVGESYARTLPVGDDRVVWLEVGQAKGDALQLTVHDASPEDILPTVRAVRRLFDLDADPGEIARSFAGDALLTELLAVDDGVRVPGAVDPFECAVRVLLGQQVTVKGATTLTGRLVERFGGKTVCAGGRLTHVFPRAEALVEADLGGVGLPKARAQALHALARAVAEGSVDLSPLSDRAQTRRALEAVRGIGPWTADVIALRALHDPDVFPAGDLGLRRAAGAEVSEAQLRRRAEAWAPWRSYAALLLWRAAATESTTN